MKLNGTLFLMEIQTICQSEPFECLELRSLRPKGDSYTKGGWVCCTISQSNNEIVIFNDKIYRYKISEVVRSFKENEIVQIEVFGGELTAKGFDGDRLSYASPPFQGNSFILQAPVVIISKLTETEKETIKEDQWG